MFMLRLMRIGTFDLDEAFRTDSLLAATSGVQIWWVIQKADGAFASVFIEIGLNWLTIYK